VVGRFHAPPLCSRRRGPPRCHWPRFRAAATPPPSVAQPPSPAAWRSFSRESVPPSLLSTADRRCIAPDDVPRCCRSHNAWTWGCRFADRVGHSLRIEGAALSSLLRLFEAGSVGFLTAAAVELEPFFTRLVKTLFAVAVATFRLALASPSLACVV